MMLKNFIISFILSKVSAYLLYTSGTLYIFVLNFFFNSIAIKYPLNLAVALLIPLLTKKYIFKFTYGF